MKFIQEAKIYIWKPKNWQKSLIFSEEKVNLKLLKKFKKSSHVDDKKILKLITVAEKGIAEFSEAGEKIPIRLDYVGKREIDRSNLYSFNGPFQLVHADITKLEFLGKSAATSRYAVVGWFIFVKSLCLSNAFSKTAVKISKRLLWWNEKQKKK